MRVSDDEDVYAPATGANLLRPVEPLWRGLAVFRALTFLLATAGVLVALDQYASPVGALVVQGVVLVWTVASGVVYLGVVAVPRGPVAIADIVVTGLVMATTVLVQTPAQLAADHSIQGSVWTAGAVLSGALAGGMRGGVAAAVAISGVLLLISHDHRNEIYDIQLHLLVGLTIGFASTVLQRQARSLRRAIAEQATMAERERLARAVHDGVLQVLGYVQRRGRQVGGEAAELAALAGEQERVLRTMLISGPDVVDATGQRDLAAALRQLGSGRITVSTPAHPVPLPASVVAEVVAAVGAALTNVTVHVGPDAPAWVLLEDVAGAVEIGVRDDGPGIPSGRLEQAEAEGRMGVARSMHGRVRDLGGSLTCETGPGIGTEWTLTIPRTTVKERTA